MRKLKLELWIEAGEKSCALRKGVFCKHLRANLMGTQWFCSMFGKGVQDETGGVEGWLQRLPECLEVEVP